MSKFITLFQQKKSVEARMKKIKYEKNTSEEYQKLKTERDSLNDQLNKIIKEDGSRK